MTKSCLLNTGGMATNKNRILSLNITLKKYENRFHCYIALQGYIDDWIYVVDFNSWLDGFLYIYISPRFTWHPQCTVITQNKLLFRWICSMDYKIFTRRFTQERRYTRNMGWPHRRLTHERRHSSSPNVTRASLHQMAEIIIKGLLL